MHRICVGSTRKYMGRRLCSANDFQGARGSLSRAQLHVEGTFKLGKWVSVQRRNRDTCPLNVSNGWMPSDLFGIRLKRAWEEGFAALTISKPARVTVPCLRRHVEGTFKLGPWVNSQRANQRHHVR